MRAVFLRALVRPVLPDRRASTCRQAWEDRNNVEWEKGKKIKLKKYNKKKRKEETVREWPYQYLGWLEERVNVFIRLIGRTRERVYTSFAIHNPSAGHDPLITFDVMMYEIDPHREKYILEFGEITDPQNAPAGVSAIEHPEEKGSVISSAADCCEIINHAKFGSRLLRNNSGSRLAWSLSWLVITFIFVETKFRETKFMQTKFCSKWI